MPFDPDAYPVEVPIAEQHQQRLDAAYDAMNAQSASLAQEVQQEVDLMTEARIRFAKAALYEQIINGQLFEGDDAVTLAVEEEFKLFAEERLRILLGMESESQTPKGVKFDADEVTILKGWAAKIMGRPVAIPRPEAPAAKLVAPRPVQAASSPVGQLAAPKRGRGRPPGTGKHQVAARAAQAAAVAPPPRQRGPLPVAPQQDPQATGQTRQVVLPNGQTRTVSIQRGPGGQVMDTAPSRDNSGPKPMPSPDEMVAQAAAIGEAGLRAFNAQVRNPDTHVTSGPTVVSG